MIKTIKISYEHRVYELVDDNSLSYTLSQNRRKKEYMQQELIFRLCKGCFTLSDSERYITHSLIMLTDEEKNTMVFF